MSEILQTLKAGAAVLGYTGAASLVVPFLAAYDEQAPNPVIHWWATNLLAASGIRTAARGLEHLPGSNFILCVNHQSNMDPVVLFHHIHRHMRFVAKAELARIPIFGLAIRKAGNIVVDRRGDGSDQARIQAAARRVRDHVSIVFFAEGTRSKDGKLQRFKKGAAAMAIDAQVPLVPAAIAGTFDILPVGSLAVRARPATLVLGPPLDTRGLTADDREPLTERAHAAVQGLLDEANALKATL